MPRVVNFIRVASFFMMNRKIEFNTFMQKRQDILKAVVQHLDIDPFVHLLVVMFECERSLESMNIPLLWSNDLVELFTQKLRTPSNLTDKLLNGIKDFMELVLAKYPTSKTAKQFQGKSFVESILQHALDSESSHAGIYMEILLKVLQACINTKAYETTELPPVITDFIAQEKDLQEKPLYQLYQLLYKPPKYLPSTIDTTAGVIAPLGSYRLKCVQLVLHLLKTNFLMLDQAIIERRLIARCIDLFFQYKWNNILHATVKSIALYTLETKPPFMCLHVLRDCQLLDRIIQADQNEEQEKRMKSPKEQGIPHVGYMGHLHEIAAAIIKASKKHTAIFYLLDEVPARGWKKFVDKLNRLQSVQEQPHPPSVSLARKALNALRFTEEM